MLTEKSYPFNMIKKIPRESSTYQHSALPNFLHFLRIPCYALGLKSPEKAGYYQNSLKHISKKPSWSALSPLITEPSLNAIGFYLAGVLSG